MTQQQTAQQIWNYLTNQGWTREAVAGVLGNMQSESGIIADRWESDNIGNMTGGYGLVQWTPATKYIHWAQQNGLVYQDVISQCKRLEWEVANGQQFYHPTMSFKQFTQSTQSPEALAEIFIKFYERPLDSNQPIRQTQARYWYNTLKANEKPKPTPSTEFKVGEIVTFTNIATNWVGGTKIGFFSMVRNFRVNRLNDDGTIYIRMMDDSWGSNVYERDIQRAPNNSIERNDVVKLRPQATHWVNGNAINIDNKTTRTFHVKARKGNQLLLYADSAGGWEVWTYDWDCILVSKFKVSKTPSYGNPNNIQANEKVTFGQNATKWKNYKGISSNVTIKLNEYNSVYNVLQRNADNTIRIQSQEDGTIHGWIKVSEAEKAPNNQFKRGDYVKLKASATHWVNGDAINIDNKTTRSFLVKTRIGNTLLVYSEAANGWQTWVYDWDVTK
ncbi:phage tail tip lysozyme [Enterococcus quebecensis]|uniref:phage tail tip lysozyme n=3 Tax=Enterococcus quebecensis TaxID=903983 RepID=UPI0014289B55|nr:phage tail tip lysozyme [Enterococcus quebecensis]